MTIEKEIQSAIALIEQRDFGGAIGQLGEVDPSDLGGEGHALLGLAHFMSEEYDEGALGYKAAIAADAGHEDRSEWERMLEACAANATAQVEQIVPPHHFFERVELLGPPEVPALPPSVPIVRKGLAHRLKMFLSEALGEAGKVFFNTATRVFGHNYLGDVWTNWYLKKKYFAILTLAYMREHLNAHNLIGVYPAGTKVAYQRFDLAQPAGVEHFRTADGSWNNLEDPKEGAAGTRFSRNVHAKVAVSETGERLLTPNPRLISQKLLRRDGSDDAPVMREVPFLNMLAASWIQFQNHDWISHGENLPAPDIIEIPLAEDDPARKKYRQSNLFIARTQPDPTRQETGEPFSATFVNEVTHWWDGSQIYGSDQKTQDGIRSHVDGKLTVTEHGTLPLGGDQVEDTGFTRNWWVGLAMMHNLFVLEHNAICDELKKHYPVWDDKRLFNTARLVNAAVMAKIHSIEWTPAILPNERLAMGLNMNWYGMLTFMFGKEDHLETVSPYNIEDPELGGLVGNPVDKHGEPFALAEEFVEIYRLHSLLPELLHLKDHRTGETIEDLPFAASRQAGSPKITEQVGMASLFYSFGNQNPGQLGLHNYPRFMQELSIPGNPVFDMGAVDIVRARERGVPRYNEFRRQLGLKSIHTFEDLTPDPVIVRQLTEIYEDVEDIDLLVGTLAEAHRPTDFGFGETMFQIFILNASRRLQADRFYTDFYNADVYTQEGLDWVDRTTLKDVLLRHYPELASTGLANVKNAFEPWDVGPLDPTRHPLRKYDRKLKKDPWRGDAS